MRVTIKRVPLGYKLTPDSKKIRDEIKEHLAEYDPKSDGTAFIQSEDEFEGVAANVLGLTKRDRADLENGWPVTKNNVDEYDYYQGVVGDH